MKILNLFSGIGGNRFLWDANNEHQIEAVEQDMDVVRGYEEIFPNDLTVQANAFQYLEEHFHIFKDFDLIWASPPCQSHSRLSYYFQADHMTVKLPDYRLYCLINFLQHFCKVPWVVENVHSYYTPPIIPTYKIGRHSFWTGYLPPVEFYQLPSVKFINLKDDSSALADWLGMPVVQGAKLQWYRNCVHPLIGKSFLDTLTGVYSTEHSKQDVLNLQTA